jgi:hypothetical protein
VAGLVVLGLVGIQLSLQIATGTAHLRFLRTHRRLAHREWQTRIAIAEARLADTKTQAQEWQGFRKFEVRKKVFENPAKDICSFYLYPHDGESLPHFSPGQFLLCQVEVTNPEESSLNLGEAEARCYSLSDAPNYENYRVTIRRIPPPQGTEDVSGGVVSNYFHDRIKEGSLIDIEAPSGDFYLETAKDTPVVLIGAGVGVTPILSMMNSLAAASSTRETWIFYGLRSGEDAVMLDAFERAAALPNTHVVWSYSGSIPEAFADRKGTQNAVLHRKGRVDMDCLKELLPGNHFDFYFCGPAPMMAALENGLGAWGVPERFIHYEAFAPESSESDTALAAASETLEVRFDAENKMIAWSGEKSIFAMARKNNFNTKRIKYACRQGKCKSCLTAVKSGTVAYPHVQPEGGVEDGYCLPCICVPATALELDA